jgi:hypothetical protein
LDKRRILVSVGKNTSSSRHEFDTFPPEKFPILLHLLFNRRDSKLRGELKILLCNLPRDKARHRFTFNKYTSGVSLRCYFNHGATMLPLMRLLEGENLWKGVLLDDDVVVNVDDLINQAECLCPNFVV